MSMGPENDDIRISKAEMQDKCGWGEECHIRLRVTATFPTIGVSTALYVRSSATAVEHSFVTFPS